MARPNRSLRLNTQSTILSTVQTFLLQSWRFNRVLTLAAVLHILVVPLLLVGMVVDPKVITGANAWIKPLKFALSSAIYGFTFGWLLTYIRGEGKWRKRFVQTAATITGLVLIIETLLITIQVMRNVPSHFNISTPVDMAIFNVMGAAISLLALMNLLALITLAFQRMDERIFSWSIRLGLIASFVGMSVGFMMTAGPTPEQIALLEATGEMPTVGAHSVGVPDGGEGLPFLGWSTEGGDLRVPHFFGLHAMQLIPLLGWLLTLPTTRRRLSNESRLWLVLTGGFAYIGWIVLLIWQALRGQSVITPDGTMLFAYGLMIGGVVMAVGLALLQPQRQREAPDPLPTAL